MADVKVRFGEYKTKEREDVLIKPVKSYVLVSGLDHHDLWSFNKFALVEKKRIDNLANDEEIQIIYLVDILPGTITRIEKDEGKVTEKITTYDQIARANYTRYGFDGLGKNNYITKKTIYDIVGEIGSKNSKTLMEMNIFSHAYWNGPILANTFETDIIDIDMRRDEIPSVAGKFSSAINSSGYLKIWGCNFPRETNAIFSKIRKNAKYKNSAIDDSQIFTFSPNTFYYKFGNKELDLVGLLNNRIGTSFKVGEEN